MHSLILMGFGYTMDLLFLAMLTDVSTIITLQKICQLADKHYKYHKFKCL